MSDSLRIVGGGVEVDLYPWLNQKVRGMEALAGILGFGLPSVTNQWFEGAGGSTYRGARVGRRVINLPLQIYAASRGELWEQLSDLAIVFDPFREPDIAQRGVARMYFGGPDGYEWYVDVVRSGGGDWARKKDSDDRTYFKTTLALEAGDSFWTRDYAESFPIELETAEETLLPYFAELHVGSTATTGVKEVTNVGDTWAWPTITFDGPISGFILTGPKGEVLEWTGTLLEGEKLFVDMRNNTIEDDEGNNLYGGLADAPRFWYIAPGTSMVSIVIDDMTSASRMVAEWRPRRWAVV